MVRAQATPFISLPKTTSDSFGKYLRVHIVPGTAVIATAGANNVEMGFLKERLLGTGLGGGSGVAPVLANAEGSHYCIVDGAVTIFARLYRAAAGKLSATDNGEFYGIALGAGAADGDAVEVLPISSGGGGGSGSTTLFANVAASAEVENTTDETNFDKTYTLPANSLAVGDVLRFRGQVLVVDNNSSDTLIIRFKIGSTEVVATAAVDVADNDIGYVEGSCIIRTIGSGGTFVASGAKGLGVPDTVTNDPWLKGSTAIDTTAAQILAVSAKWSAAHADNEVRLDVLHIELLR